MAKRRFDGTRWVGPLALLAVLGGCATARMMPPGDLAGRAELLEVTDRSSWSGSLVDEGFKLGPYQVSEVDRDWDSSSGYGAGPWSKETKTTGFTYQFEGKGSKLRGTCASETWEQGVLGISWGDTTVACRCEGGGEASLVLSPESNQLDLAGKKYEVQRVYETDNGQKNHDPVGFRVDGATGPREATGASEATGADSAPLGAVDVLRPGRAWVAQATDANVEAQVSCIFAGLLLYQPPKKEKD